MNQKLNIAELNISVPEEIIDDNFSSVEEMTAIFKEYYSSLSLIQKSSETLNEDFLKYLPEYFRKKTQFYY